MYKKKMKLIRTGYCSRKTTVVEQSRKEKRTRKKENDDLNGRSRTEKMVILERNKSEHKVITAMTTMITIMMIMVMASMKNDCQILRTPHYHTLMDR